MTPGAFIPQADFLSKEEEPAPPVPRLPPHGEKLPNPERVVTPGAGRGRGQRPEGAGGRHRAPDFPGCQPRAGGGSRGQGQGHPPTDLPGSPARRGSSRRPSAARAGTGRWRRPGASAPPSRGALGASSRLSPCGERSCVRRRRRLPLPPAQPPRAYQAAAGPGRGQGSATGAAAAPFPPRGGLKGPGSEPAPAPGPVRGLGRRLPAP